MAPPLSVRWYQQIPAWLVVLALALLARVFVAVWLPDRILWADGHKYDEVALSLVAGQGFGSLVLNCYSVPAQAVLFAAVFKVFGHSYLALRITFAVLGAMSCLVGHLIARRLFGSTAGWLAGIGLALYPPLVYLSCLFEYPQAPFILLMSLVFLLLLQYRQSGGLLNLALASVSLGIAILAVPTVLLYVPFAVVCAFWSKRAPDWRGALMVGAVVCMTLAPWIAHNYVAYHRFILVNKAGGTNLWLANNDAYYLYGKTLAMSCDPPASSTRWCAESRELAERMARANRPDQPEVEVALVFDYEHIAYQRALAFITESPGRFLALSVRRFFDFWNPFPEVVTRTGAVAERARDALAAATYIPVLILALIGVVLTASRWLELLPLYCYVAVFTAAYSVFLPTLRYRLPLDFVLILFAAATLQWLLQRRSGAAGSA